VARGRYSDEVRAACVAALLAGQQPAAVAAQYNVPAATVRSWKSRAGIGGTERSSPVVSEDARAQIGELLLGYLASLIAALTAQAKIFADPEWLRKQSAGELAVLHGIGVDKAVRLLEALEGPEADEDAEAGDEPVS
jgi:transposase-like protein